MCKCTQIVLYPRLQLLLRFLTTENANDVIRIFEERWKVHGNTWYVHFLFFLGGRTFCSLQRDEKEGTEVYTLKVGYYVPLLAGPQSPGLGSYLITAFGVDPLMTTPRVPSGVLNIALPLNLFPLVISKFIFPVPSVVPISQPFLRLTSWFVDAREILLVLSLALARRQPLTLCVWYHWGVIAKNRVSDEAIDG